MAAVSQHRSQCVCAVKWEGGCKKQKWLQSIKSPTEMVRWFHTSRLSHSRSLARVKLPQSFQRTKSLFIAGLETRKANGCRIGMLDSCVRANCPKKTANPASNHLISNGTGRLDFVLKDFFEGRPRPFGEAIRTPLVRSRCNLVRSPTVPLKNDLERNHGEEGIISVEKMLYRQSEDISKECAQACKW